MAPAADRFDALLRGHLRRLEGIVFPILTIGVSVAGCAAIEQQILGGNWPLRLRMFLLPWLLDESDAVIAAQVVTTVPLPFRRLTSAVVRCHYERTVAPVRALAGRQAGS